VVSSGSPAIDVEGLRKSFGGGLRRRARRRALDGLDLVVESGGRVHGFLGPNGSGKTTTLRTLLGLVHSDGGNVRLFGNDVPAGLPDVVADVGAIVEAPQFFGSFSGRRNLVYLADVAGVPAKRIDEMLDVVDLRERANDRVSGYSLGMRQRLAVAAAMLKQPRLLLLDEPSNGLDPAGIRDVRALLRRLAEGGTTVLLSSHLLGEVQQVCDEVTIIAHGRRITTGSVADVLATAGPHGGRVTVRVRETDVEPGRQVLAAAGISVSVANDRLVVAGGVDSAEVNRLLADRGIYASEIMPESADLEEAFLLLTEGVADEPTPVAETGATS
jgi:ABC-2 type transport system ATP-binding protein